MGLLIKKTLENGSTIGIWRMEEVAWFFTQRLDLQEVELKELSPLKGRRQLEWLASRYLVHEMLLAKGMEDRIPVLKDEFGKPHLFGTPFHLSFSHSHELVAVILSEKPSGIDIQAMVPKIEVLAKKFMRPEEMQSLRPETRLQQLHFYWGAKEALYKAHGRKQLDFREHILIQPVDYQQAGKTTGIIEKAENTWQFEVFFEQFWDYMLVWCHLI
ncbi:MAG: 4'-phosphopantetheinyl transferase superfamily protein [Saprospiraceae bacterium]|nr:4'-phosphopantetheinyl transferase superfamily protein [Saprospiraceae bacterium]